MYAVPGIGCGNGVQYGNVNITTDLTKISLNNTQKNLIAACPGGYPGKPS
jgi:hypothetical protein